MSLVPMREIIDLVSSPPLPRNSPSPLGTRSYEASLTSSPLPPSPSAMFNAFAERAAANAVEAKLVERKEDKIPAELSPPPPPPPPPTKKKRAAKATTGVKKPRTQKAAGKARTEKVKLKDGKITAKVVKSQLEQTGTKSKYFPQKQANEQACPEKVVGHQECFTEIPGTQDPFSESILGPGPLPSYPEPPLHVIRRQWTPIKTTALKLDSSSPLTDGDLKEAKLTTSFESMVGLMRYSTESSDSAQEATISIENRGEYGLIKKRAIEMISLPTTAVSMGVSAMVGVKDKVPKPKAPKQKRKTITDQATASYRTVNDPTASPLLQYFPLNETLPATEQVELQKVPSRKTGSPAKKKRKSDTETVVLLSPTSAWKRFDSQEFVFGTCSQLEGTDKDQEIIDYDTQSGIDLGGQDNGSDELPSPSTSVVRKYKSLFREGNEGVEAGKFAAENYSGDLYIPTTAMQEQASRQGGSRLSKPGGTSSRLWDAAARDPDGGFLNVEVIDMTGSDDGNSGCLKIGGIRPAENNQLRGDGTMTTGTAVIGSSATRNHVEGWCQGIEREPQVVEKAAAVHGNNPVQTIRDLRDSSWAISSSASTLLAAPHAVDLAWKRALENSSRSISTSATTPLVTLVGGKSSLANIMLDPLEASKVKKSKQPAPVPLMPDFESYHLTKLKTEVAKFGFKAGKTRDGMISRLKSCWEAQNKARSVAHSEADNSGLVADTCTLGLPQQDTNEKEMTSALHLQSNSVLPLEKSHALSKRKKPEELKTIPKPPALKAAPKKSSSSKATPPRDDDDDDSPEVVELLKKPGSPKRKSTSKARSRKNQPAELEPAQLHYRISEAVRESGRTESEFSFYNSILMYRPIILEDMALWLNSKCDLGEKVDVEQLKAWCEENGVCCVRRETVWGKQRKRLI